MSSLAKFNENSYYFPIGQKQIREGEEKPKHHRSYLPKFERQTKKKHESSLIREAAPKHSAFTKVYSLGL